MTFASSSSDLIDRIKTLPKHKHDDSRPSSQPLYPASAGIAYPNAKEVLSFLSKSRITETKFTEEHVEMLLNVLVLDGDVERVRPPLRCSFGTPLMSHNNSSRPLALQYGRTTTSAMTCPRILRLPTRKGFPRIEDGQERDKLRVTRLQQTQRTRMVVPERNRLKGHSHPGTNEGSVSVIPKIWAPVTATATGTPMSKDEKNGKLMTTTVKTRMGTSRNACHPSRKGSQVGGVRCRSWILNPRLSLHMIATRRKSQNPQDLPQIHESPSCRRNPRRELTRALALP